MNLMNRLTIKKDCPETPEELNLDMDKIDFSNKAYPYYLYVDGTMTHQLQEIYNENPKNIMEIGSKILVLVPTEDWCTVCKNNNMLTKMHNQCDPLNDDELVPKELVIYSSPYDKEAQKMECFTEMVKKINEHMKWAIETIEGASAS